VDYVALWVVVAILYSIGAAVNGVFTFLGVLLGLGGSVFLAVQLGQYGSTPGMRMIGLRCVSETTGQPIGAGMGVVRMLAHFIDTIICYVGWLFPLWDSKRQTLADKVIGTVVVTVPKQRLSLTPPA